MPGRILLHRCNVGFQEAEKAKTQTQSEEGAGGKTFLVAAKGDSVSLSLKVINHQQEEKRNTRTVATLTSLMPDCEPRAEQGHELLFLCILGISYSARHAVGVLLNVS